MTSIGIIAELEPTAAELPIHARVRYPALLESGVDWLGTIPSHWRLSRLRFACRLNPSKGDIAHLPDDTIVSFLPMELISEDGVLTLTETRSINQVKQGYTYFRDGDVIVAKITPCFENGKGAHCSGLVNGIAFGTTELHVLRAGPGMFSKFLFYITRSDPFRTIGEASMYGAAGQQRVPENFIKDFPVSLPPLDEQRAIAGFLDRETAQIDALVAKKERLIELLQEKRAALISHAVTKGLDPDAPMKDSGVEWIGAIPAHWTAPRLKTVARLRSGHTPSRSKPEYWENCTIPWVSLADVWQLRSGTVDTIVDTAEKISELGLANSSARLLPAGTVVLSRTASVGYSGILGGPMATTQDFANWVCTSTILPRYLLHCFRSMRNEFTRLTMGSTHQTIYMPQIAAFSVPLPPVEEQQAIDNYITEQTAAIDALVIKVQEHIDHLHEHRTALISAAVTGKIDVRGEVEVS